MHIHRFERKFFIEIYQLRSFATVAELGQLTRAGEALHVSQPAITAQIKALEDELQVELFERTSSGMLLTRAGARLLEHAENVLAAAHALKNQAKALLGEVAGKISLGTVTDPDAIRLGELLNVMLERFPLVELELQQRVSGQAFEDVRNGALNASFYFGALNNPSVTGLRLGNLVYCVAAPVAWRGRVEAADWTGIAAPAVDFGAGRQHAYSTSARAVSQSGRGADQSGRSRSGIRHQKLDRIRRGVEFDARGSGACGRSGRQSDRLGQGTTHDGPLVYLFHRPRPRPRHRRFDRGRA